MIKPFSGWLVEAIASGAMNQALSVIEKYLAKKLETKVVRIPGIEQFKNSKEKGFGIRYIYDKTKCIRFNWTTGKLSSSSLNSIDLWDGTKSDPSFNIGFDRGVSLVKILPSIIDVIQNPKMGSFLSVPEDNLNEGVNLSWEGSLSEIGNMLKRSEQMTGAAVKTATGWRGETIWSHVAKNYQSEFKKEGRAWVWNGSADPTAFLNSKKDEIFQALGAVKTAVSRGGTGETYAPTEEENRIEQAGGIEKIAYEEQLVHLKQLVKLVLKGASYALFVAGRGGTGKALPNETPVLMFDGTWKMIKDIREGDVVTTQDGNPSVVTGVFPQGQRPCFKLTFGDGRQNECDEDHLWEVSNSSWKNPRVLTTKQIKDLMESGEKFSSKFQIPLFNPKNGEDVDLPLDPWLVGFLIGDGSLTNNTTCFSTKDDFLLEKVRDQLEDGYEITHQENYDYLIENSNRIQGSRESNFYTSMIKSLGLDVKSFQKFIPECYKKSSLIQKIELISGLMDSDGYVDEGGSMSYTTTSERLANDVVEIIRSIGGEAKITGPYKTGYFSHKKNEYIECRLAYDVWIRHPNKQQLISIPRKKNRISENGTYRNSKLAINSIEKSEIKDCTCIKIDDPRGLFVIENYTVTHNTQQVEAALAEQGLTDGAGYFKVTGTSSTIGLYDLLFRNRKSIILFDDADGVVADQDARNLLKAATDTKKVRKIVWNKAGKRFVDPETVGDDYWEDPENDESLPKWFEFTGKVIFISNLKIDKLDPDGALRTRALMIDIDPTDAEIFDYMEKIIDNIQLEEGNKLDHDGRVKVVEILRASSGSRKDVSLRKLVRGLNICAALGGEDSNWKRLVELYA